MSNVSNSNIGGPEHASHIQVDEFNPDGGDRVLCSCGVTWVAGEDDHSEHTQVEDFDEGLVHCSCGASWLL